VVLSLGSSVSTPPVAKRFFPHLWGVITLPLLVAGFIALAITEFKIGELHMKAEANLSAARNSPADK